MTKFIKPWKPEASICLQSIWRMSSKYTRYSEKLVRAGQTVKFLLFSFQFHADLY